MAIAVLSLPRPEIAREMVVSVKKIKNEHDLIKEAVRVGTKYAEKRGVAQFEATDSQDDKIEFIYKLLVHDNLIQPLAKDDISLPNMRHKLAIWISKQLPEDHPLLQ
jgi:predicted transcriptional regulator